MEDLGEEIMPSGIPLTKHELEQVVEMYEEGETHSSIAKKMGITSYGVYHVLRRHRRG